MFEQAASERTAHPPLSARGLFTRGCAVAEHAAEVGLTTLAGNLAFRLSFAAFPSLIAVLWLLRAIHAESLAGATSEVLGTVVPGVAHAPLKEQANGSQSGSGGELTLGIAASLVVSVWAISEVFRAAIHALNVISGVKDTRGAVQRLVMTIAAAAGTVLCFTVALAVIVSGTRLTWSVAGSAGLARSYGWLWGMTAWLVVVAFVWAGFTLLYEVGPAKDRPFRLFRFGSLLAVALWVAFTAIFALYANFLAKPEETYGALAGVAFLMIYSYGSAAALLLGAELNRELPLDHPGHERSSRP